MTADGWTVISGATGEIGRVATDRLVAEGHRVLAVARDPEKLADLARHERVTACPADLRDDAAVDVIAAAVGDAPVRMVVHLAAAPLGGDILSVPPDVVLAAVDVKVNGLLRLVRAVQARLQPGSRIVAVGGNLAFDPNPAVSTAGIANAGQANAVRQLSRALGPGGVTCNTIAPGPVATDRWYGMTAEEAAREGVPVEEVRRRAVTASPLGRLTEPSEVAWAIARLADPEAAALTGSTLLLDAGRRNALP
jgi:NAD(P)-dependent dehydrogenase (short-subunit alcohol dehydrogenase family)